MARWLARFVAVFLLAVTLACPAQAEIWVSLAGEDGPYEEMAAVLRAEWRDRPVVIGPWTALAERAGPPPDLVVTVGAAAFDGMLKSMRGRGPAWESVPVLGTLLPQLAYKTTVERLRPGRRPVSAVVLDQPFARQMDLIRHALPSRQRVAVMTGPQTRPYLKTLEREAQARGMQLIPATGIAAPEDIFPALRQVLEQADVLLALPDTLVYNNSNLQNILLTTYRARVPVVTFSPAYVKAGALLAVYSTPAQVARQVVRKLAHWRPGQPLPEPSSPGEFAVAANPKVAATLGIGLDDAVQIAEDLRATEGRL
ncbi:MAG: ABC transporter substrate binding protein [Rhodocyclaceae bacterium]|jgi:hypothetical protein|nr:ABC transporter substrate binding protein [Rhodocyclaceae bacterium]